jgi:catechol 2,3-dioxygenase-like lactoylglutathione lyase family enzyme
MKVTAVTHIAICVRDLEKSIHFYRDILGMKVTIKESQPMANRPGATSQAMYENSHVSRTTAHVAFDGPDPTLPFLVLTTHPGEHLSGQPIKLDQIGISHLSFIVDDVKRVADELIAKGIPPAGALEDFYEKKETLRTFFVHDPDGILVQFEAAV